MVKRLVKLSKTRSFFLFGPRSTGKTTLLKSTYSSSDNLWVDLLNTKTEHLLRRNPENLESLINTSPNRDFVIIDEIQKNPDLLNVVHRLMTEKKQRFILTGSSARKLKRGAANLLAGRASSYSCHPLTSLELKEDFDLFSTLRFGSLPELYSLDDEDKKDFLRAYVDTYFKEEIVAEQLIRNLAPFKNFLEIAAQSNTKIINVNKIANEIDVDHTTARNYFSILEDTLVGYLLPAYHTSLRRRQRLKPKFYYFDLGVQRALTHRLEVPLTEGNYEFGAAFEHFLILEIKRLSDYFRPDWQLSYYQTADNSEVDLLIERPGEKTVLLEIKSTQQISSIDQQKLIGFKKIATDFPNSDSYIVSRDSTSQLQEDSIQYIYWENLLQKLFE